LFEGDLLAHYLVVLRQSWKDRLTAGTVARIPYELEFLPAHLEITDTPPHPAAFWTARVIMAAALLTVAIAVFGQLDIVAIAPGQLLPNANIKLIQAAATGVVRHIGVDNGQRVVPGQVLVDLDPTQAGADADKATASKLEAQLAMARARALITAQDTNRDPVVATVAGAASPRQADNQRLADGSFQEFRRRIASLKAELLKREADLDSTREQVSKLQQTTPIARQQADDYKELAKGKYVSSHDYLDKERLAIEESHELAAQQMHARELAASIDVQRQDIEAAAATFRREQLETLNKAEEAAAQTQNEATKADARRGLMQIKSPVAGIVQQLSVHTTGGVVSSGQTVMEIVPDDTLEVEAHISNKDIGFVNPGQSAIVKIATFPYTRFGYLPATVIKVSNDALSDKKLGLVFATRLRIPSNRFQVGNKWVNLSPGMEVTAEIKTGHQSVWQYFLSPLIQTARESLRER